MQKGQLNLKTIKQVDKSAMLDLLLDFPRQCSIALTIAEKAKTQFKKADFNKITFVGLGGSAIGADVIRSYLYLESKIPINVYREYILPSCVDSSSLVFILSYSGNTEEVLSAYRQAKEKGASLIVISSGGKLKEFSLADGLTFVEVPAGLPPRCALGYLSIVPLVILSRLGIIKEQAGTVTDTIKALEELRQRILNPSVSLKNNLAKSIAQDLFNKFVVIYSASVHFDVCATRLRSQLSENSKTIASSHSFPELNHNEIVGWQSPGKLLKDFSVLLLRDKQTYVPVAKSMDIVSGMLKKEGIKVIEVWSQGESLLSRIFSLIYIGDFISYYLAILYRIDPAPVEKITYLKNKLAKN